MATLSAVRWDAVMKTHYQQLRARGKVAKVALVACMRKLLTIVNGPLERIVRRRLRMLGNMPSYGSLPQWGGRRARADYLGIIE
jgi:hypothetical protein